MKRLVLLLVLGGCASTPSTSSTIADVQQRTYAHCGYTVSTTAVQRILAQGNEILNDPETMALAICQSIKGDHK